MKVVKNDHRSKFANLSNWKEDNLTIKHCDRTKVKTITVKNSKSCQKTLKSDDDVSTFTQRHFQVKMNKKKLFEYKCTKTNPWRVK